MEERTKRLGEESLGKLLLAFSIPSIVGTLAFGSTNIINTIFIGRNVGALALSALGLCFPIFAIFMGIGMLIGVGGGAVASLKLGAKKTDEAEQVLGNVLFLLVIFALTISGILFSHLDQVLVFFGATSDTLPFAKSYMQIISLSIIFNFMSMGLNNLIRAEGNPTVAMNTLLIIAILNILFNFIFILYLELGVTGAAISTVLAHITSATWVLLHFLLKKSTLNLRVKNLWPNPSIIKQIVSIGLSPFLMQIVASIVGIIANKTLLQHGGPLAIGAMSIIMNVGMFILMPVIGINQGSQPIFGFNYGAKKFDRVRTTLNLVSLLATIISVAGFITVEIFPHAVLSIFSKGDPELVAIGENGIRIFFAAFFVVGFQVAATNFFQAIGRAKISIFLTLLRQGFLFIPLLLLLPPYLGLNGVWIAGAGSDFIAALITILLVIRESNKLKKYEL